ncbi:winged helix-turn-helix domain-containing protein [Vibrio sp. B1FLJ16]|uniref:winged helix-turn-helix domain-containing protein n=1 Tax=Vibrio sp. B1FLJ16 TaxID=2751178 RepID=UPI001AF1C9FE|nr:winged helix-turn-helix domain-containing protein [Vibrio sp. B1FLJ16]CAD7814573.1 Transcriptional activator CadC [Vibrio sp. B1FLJ16]CAE6924296.1 Transcriptional activator CadC [Vibrio sp. B1FLJ16]
MAGVYFRINDWVLDVDENKLYRKDREVTAEPRLINLLSFLADNANQIFTREALILSVWERDTVADQVVTQSIFELRKLLADGRDDYPSYVITVPKRGYKLVADVSLMTAAEFRAFRLSECDYGKEAESDSESNDTRVRPKYDSAVQVTGKEIHQLIQKKRSERLWRLGFLGITLISLMVSIITVLTYKKPEVKKSHPIDTHLIEFKMQNNSGLNDDFVDGLTKKNNV